MFVCVFVWTWVYKHLCVHRCLFVCVRVSEFLRACVCVCVRVHVRVRMRVRVRVRVCMRMCMCMRLRIRVCVSGDLHTYTDTWDKTHSANTRQNANGVAQHATTTCTFLTPFPAPRSTPKSKATLLLNAWSGHIGAGTHSATHHLCRSLSAKETYNLWLFCGKRHHSWRVTAGTLSQTHSRATNYRALLRKMTYKEKVSYGSLPLCRKTVIVLNSRSLFLNSIYIWYTTHPSH